MFRVDWLGYGNHMSPEFVNEGRQNLPYSSSRTFSPESPEGAVFFETVVVG
ncbi:MAG: hypothetical protein UX41_C0015G0003 [Candidatus Collierbacteria bacterium GW2011_GWE1_46_18]|uniref:Uncharacterized protein n=1 Tax=Candidatus Collierbacteria bacterium GW2011_GWE1_46_18 TaxID=1618399 RepID=A0A0G1P9Q2_9BACT|nr:MAG: hypothetical protein UX41_C0015G0003 [Candidatus Collierbacteria bacterium GW2011_GWE1_46_18]